MSDVKRYQIGGRDIPASAAVFLPSEVVSSADYDALAAAHEQAWKSATSESHAWAREHEARMLVVAERDQLRAELEAIRGQQAVAWASPDVAGGVRWSPGALQQLSDGAPLYALPPQQPDAVSVPREFQPHDYRQSLQCWFGLGRASWCTIPRVLMEAMPEEWQRQAAILLHEYSEAFPGGRNLPTPYVQARVDGRITNWPEWINNYRHPDRAAIDGLRPSTKNAEEGQPCDK